MAKKNMSTKDFTEGYINRGIKIGNDMHFRDNFSPNSFSNMVSKYCNNLVTLNYNKNRDGLVKSNPFNFSGSMTCVSYRGKFIGISTRHQVDANGYEMRDVAWTEYIKDEVTTHSGPGKIVFDEQYNPKVSDHRNFYLYDFTDVKVRNRAAFEDRFFSLAEENIFSVEDQNEDTRYFIYGYLEQDQSGLDFGTLERTQGPVSIRYRQIWCKPDVSPINRCLGRCRPEFSFSTNLNFKGIEGGPVFVLTMEDDNLVVKFAGVLIETDSWRENKFDFIKARELKFYLDNL